MNVLKKYLIAIIFLQCMPIYADYGTFFRPRSLTFNQTFELALNNYDIFHTDHNFFSLYIEPLYQQSTHSSSVGSFFLPNCQPCISIKEDGTGNVGSLWLDLISTDSTYFSSNICLNPKRTSYGSYFNAHFNLDAITCGLWFRISFAAIKTKHNIGLCEFGLENPGTLNNIATATQALNNPMWCFGKFSPCTLRKTGIDDIEIKLGYNYYFSEDNLLGIYGIGGIPTGKRSKAQYVFEPLVGSNHGCLGFGLKGDYAINYCDNNVVVMTDFRYRYIFSAYENRSFDLCANGKWSRYLQVVSEATPSNPIPAINFLTQTAKVTPGSSIDWWTALNYSWCEYTLELGYDFWYQQREKICVTCPFPRNVGIYDIEEDSRCMGMPTSASMANISESVRGINVAPSDEVFTALTEQDLNTNSGAAQQSLSSTIYGGFSYNPIIDDRAYLFGLVLSYEISHNNTAFNQWAIWFDWGIHF